LIVFSRTTSFTVVVAAGVATLTAASAPSPLYPVYQRLWGFSAFTLTLIFAAYVIALLAALLTIGSLSDRIGRRPIASGALVLLVLGMLEFAVADGVGALVAARVVQGFAVGAATGTVTAMIIDTARTPRVGAIVSSAAPSLGIAVGAVLAGGLVEYAPLPRQLIFWVLAGMYLVLSVLVWWVPEVDREERPIREPLWRSLLPSAGLPSSTRAVFVTALPAICAAWALAGLYLSLGSSVIGTVLAVHNHLVVGTVLGVFFVAGIGGTWVSSGLPRRIHETAGYAGLVVGTGMTTGAVLFHTMSLYVIGSAVAGIGYGATFRNVVDELGRAAPAAQRGQVFATMYIASYTAFSLPALMAGIAVERYGLDLTTIGYGLLVITLTLVAATASMARLRGVHHDSPTHSEASD
jgi:hypothetical protein